MALYVELPVFKKSYDLLLALIFLCNNLSKSFRYTFGERLQKEAMEMIIEIYRANSQIDKVAVLKQARERLEVIRLLIRILFDTKQIGLKRMIAVNETIEEISKQLAGWQKHSQL